MRRRESAPEQSDDGVPDPLFHCCWWCWHEPGDANHAFIGHWDRARDDYAAEQGLQRHEVPRAAGFVACPAHQADYDAWRASQGTAAEAVR